jgi:hypothetical protein
LIFNLLAIGTYFGKEVHYDFTTHLPFPKSKHMIDTISEPDENANGDMALDEQFLLKEKQVKRPLLKIKKSL